MKKIIFLALIVLIGGNTMAQKRKSIAKHVILIGLDGWGAYSLPTAEMPNVKALMASGRYTLKCRSVLPSSSAANWASMFMGAGPELHGYTQWDSRKPELPSRVTGENGIFPTIFQRLRAEQPNATLAAFYEWKGIKYLVDTISLNYHALFDDYTKNPTRMTDAAIQYITQNKPTLMGIFYDNPDHIGHTIGHNTPEYYAKLKEVDAYIGQIIQSLKDAGIYENSILILSSDHGGVKKGHGGKSLNEMEIPFIIAGKRVKNLGEFNESMMQYDVAATLAYIFKLKQPQVWIGRPMTQVFK